MNLKSKLLITPSLSGIENDKDIKLTDRNEGCFFPHNKYELHPPLKQHIQEDDNAYCVFCKEYYVDRHTLYQHLQSAHRICPLCPAVYQFRYYDNATELRSHYYQAHFVCADCEQDQLSLQQTTSSTSSSPSSPSSSFAENVVYCCFPDSTSLQSHIYTVHQNRSLKDKEDDDEKRAEEEISVQTKHQTRKKSRKHQKSKNHQPGKLIIKADTASADSHTVPDANNASEITEVLTTEIQFMDLGTDFMIISAVEDGQRNQKAANLIYDHRDGDEGSHMRVLGQITGTGRFHYHRSNGIQNGRVEEVEKMQIRLDEIARKERAVLLQSNNLLPGPYVADKKGLIEEDNAFPALSDSNNKENRNNNHNNYTKNQVMLHCGKPNTTAATIAVSTIAVPSKSYGDGEEMLFPVELVIWAQDHLSELVSIEKRLAIFFTSQQQSLAFKPMKQLFDRQVLHCIARYYACNSYDYDLAITAANAIHCGATKTYVTMVKTGYTSIPAVLLSTIITSNRQNVIPTSLSASSFYEIIFSLHPKELFDSWGQESGTHSSSSSSSLCPILWDANSNQYHLAFQADHLTIQTVAQHIVCHLMQPYLTSFITTDAVVSMPQYEIKRIGPSAIALQFHATIDGDYDDECDDKKKLLTFVKGLFEYIKVLQSKLIQEYNTIARSNKAKTLFDRLSEEQKALFFLRFMDITLPLPAALPQQQHMDQVVDMKKIIDDDQEDKLDEVILFDDDDDNSSHEEEEREEEQEYVLVEEYDQVPTIPTATQSSLITNFFGVFYTMVTAPPLPSSAVTATTISDKQQLSAQKQASNKKTLKKKEKKPQQQDNNAKKDGVVNDEDSSKSMNCDYNQEKYEEKPNEGNDGEDVWSNVPPAVSKRSSTATNQPAQTGNKPKPMGKVNRFAVLMNDDEDE